MAPRKPTSKHPQPGRDPKTGRLLKGNPHAWAPGHSGNPGGMPSWIAARRAALAEGSQEAIDFLRSVVRGDEVDISLDGEPHRVTPEVKDRVAAASLVLAYSLPKPTADAAQLESHADDLDDVPEEDLRAILDILEKPRQASQAPGGPPVH